MEIALWILVGIGALQLFVLSSVVGKLSDIFNILFDISNEVDVLSSPIHKEKLDEEYAKAGIVVDPDTGEVI